MLAGGQSLIPILTLRLGTFGTLVDLGRIPELRDVSASGASVRIGAMVMQADAERSKVVPREYIGPRPP